jgi:hypothetical protein
MATPAIGLLFGAGCDGELTPDEVAARLAEVAEAGGDLGEVPLPEIALERVEAALAHVTTEASAMALRCARGETGIVPIRGGRRHVTLTPLGGKLFAFDCTAAIGSAARLARAVLDAESLQDGRRILNELGVRTELDYEEDAAAGRL